MYNAKSEPVNWIIISRKLAASPTSGHEYKFLRLLAEAAMAEGDSSTLVGSKHSSYSDAMNLLEIGSPVSSGKVLKQSLDNDVRAFEDAFPDIETSSAVILVYEGGFRDFCLMIEMYRRFPSLRFAFNFNLTDPWHKVLQKKFRWSKLMFHRALRILISRLGDRVYFSSETHALQGAFEQAVGLHLPVFPLYSTVVNIKQTIKTVDLLGVVGSDKEAEFFFRVADQVLFRCPDASLALSTRWNFEIRPDLLARLSSQGVKIHSGLLDEESYVSLLSETKFTLLPYFDDYYFWSSSARLLDAVALNSRVFVPNTSSLASHVEAKGWGHAISANDEFDIARIITDLEWKSIENKPNSPRDALTELRQSLIEIPRREDNNEPKFKCAQDLMLYLNFALDARSLFGRLIDSNNASARVSKVLRKGLYNVTAKLRR